MSDKQMQTASRRQSAMTPNMLKSKPSSSGPIHDVEAEGASSLSRLRREWLSQLDAAFALTSVIPLLICCYLITVRFFSVEILIGLNGFYLALAVVIAVLGLLIGRGMFRTIVNRLIDAQAKLQEINMRQIEFVNHVAHEFRAPLAIVKGALENLEDGLHGPVTQDQQEPLSMSYREIDRLARLVADLLDVARIESGKMRFEQQEVALQDLVKSIGDSCERLAKERSLTLSIQISKEPAVVIGDRDRLSQVLMNLVTNAIKFTESGGVSVRIARDQDNVRVEVEDTGSGIPAEDLERIFGKFERVGGKEHEGSGLGLPIARAIVELHKGRIWAESELGRGSRFIIQLPCADLNRAANG